MIRLAALLLLLLAGPLRAECRGEDLTIRLAERRPEAFAAAERAAAARPNAEGLLWRIERRGAPPSFLFGTFHTTEPLGRIEAAALDAAKRARVLLVEIAADEEAAMQAALLADPALAALPDPAPFDEWLTPDLAAAAEARFAALGLPRAAAERLRPWFQNLMLAVPACAAAAASGGAPILDKRLARATEAAGGAVVGIETWREQIAALASLSEEDQRDGVRLALAASEAPEDVWATFHRLYVDERPMMVWELSLLLAREGAPELATAAIETEIWRSLAEDRNRRMAERAGPELAKGGAMIAVGALHLPGEAGLVELIRTQGFSVERVR